MRLALAKQHALFDALPANAAVVDAVGVITDVNGRWRAHGEASGRPSDANDVGDRLLHAIAARVSDEVGDFEHEKVDFQRLVAEGAT